MGTTQYYFSKKYRLYELHQRNSNTYDPVLFFENYRLYELPQRNSNGYDQCPLKDNGHEKSKTRNSLLDQHHMFHDVTITSSAT